MTTKRILKSVLNVKGIKIIDWKYNEKTQATTVVVSMTKGFKSRCSICGIKCPGYDGNKDTISRWRSLDHGSCKQYIECKLKRVECPHHGAHVEQVPWAFHNSRFTKEFEQQVTYMATRQTKTDVSKIMRIAQNTVGSIITRTKNRMEPDSTVRYEGVERIGIDETSYRKGHKYITVVIDHDLNQVIWVEDGHGKEVLEKFMESMNQSQRDNIKLVSADGAKWIKACIDKWLGNSDFCIDAFHVVSWAIEAMDALRKDLWRIKSLEYQRQVNELGKRGRGRPKKGDNVPNKTAPKTVKGFRYALGKNPENLTKNQNASLETIRNDYPLLFRGYQLKEGLRAVFRSGPEMVAFNLNSWLSWACRCRIPIFVELSRKIRRHKESILNTVNYRLSNARLEAMNNKIKVLIRRSYGFRNIQNMIDMIMLVCSNLYHQIKMPYETRNA